MKRTSNGQFVFGRARLARLRRVKPQRTAVVTLIFLCAGLLTAHTGRAATCTVTSTADSGPGTLRACLANPADGDTIDATGVSGTILLSSELVVCQSVTIVGPGPGNLSVDGSATSRVFHVQCGVIAAISGLTITNGAAARGGGILNDHSALTVSNCTFSGNSHTDSGSGIYNDGSLGSSATLSVSASTFSGNSASSGGGIYNDGFEGSATLSVSASTFSGNSATFGGGIYNDGSSGSAALSVSASTFSGNSAFFGGGIYNDGFLGSATLEIGDTILKTGALAHIFNTSGTVTSQGYNLSSDSGGGFLTGTADQTDTDPLLGPLQDNGGPTFTHALLPGSPAIDQGKRDAIPALALDTDQRGFPRPVDFANIPNASGGDGSDIGSFEVQVPAADLLISLGANKTSVKQGDQLTYTITVHNFGPDNAVNVVINDTLSSGTTFVSAHVNVGSFTAPPVGQTGVVTWHLVDLANNSQQAAQITVTVIVRGKTSITNTASVSSDTVDPNPANNTASITTSVASGGKRK